MMPHLPAALQQHQQRGWVYVLALMLVSSLFGPHLQVLAGGASLAPAKKAAAVTAVSAAPIKSPGTATTTTNPLKTSQNKFILPTLDQYAADASLFGEDCKLGNELFKLMGAGGMPGCNSKSSSSAKSTSSSSGSSSKGTVGSKESSVSNGRSGNKGQLTLSEYTKSSEAFRDGLFTNNAGQSFCVSQEVVSSLMKQQHVHSIQPSFSSVESSRALPDIEDPACEDTYATARDRAGCPKQPGGASFYAKSDGNIVEAAMGASHESLPGTGSTGAAPVKQPTVLQESADSTDLGMLNCSRKFLQMGSQPRSLAVVLVKWGREYYLSKEECCQAKGNTPGCDCTWGGRPYENLPPPRAFSRIFTDECDQGPSVNRGYYDLTGGVVTFHSKLRVPVPSRVGLTDDNPGVVIYNSTMPGAPGQGGVPLPVPPSSPILGPLDAVDTATSYLDPDGVDVYNWVTLDGMRDDKGNCRDWTTEAVKLAGINPNDYNHILYFQLLISPALCSVCSDGACIGTCPAATGIVTGCGCASCYAGWATQSSCSAPTPPGAKIVLGLWPQMEFYLNETAETYGGYGIKVYADMKRFFMHEAGHNMGLTHAGSIECSIASDGKTINRDPQDCKPNWYGDGTTFMGSSPTQQLPAAMKYKVKWLPRKTLRRHPRGTSARYVLRPATIRRPSWQIGRRSGLHWFDDSAALISVRIPLTGSSPTVNTSSYSCPCNPTGPDNTPMCPACNSAGCANGPCCTASKCADAGLSWYFVELHMPFRDDYRTEYRGLAIRMMGDLASTVCTSTRIVPTHVGADGKVKYLLDTPDPLGQAVGSKFEDKTRGVTVILERWANTSAVIQVIA